MLALLPCLAAIVLVYVFMWLSVLAVDEGLDAHEAGLAMVAARNPFREQGPPANMAKLILLRHKVRHDPSQFFGERPYQACTDPDHEPKTTQLLAVSPAPTGMQHPVVVTPAVFSVDAFWQGFRRETVPLIRPTTLTAIIHSYPRIWRF
ncbi:hypothetical protein B0H19DRAFT_960642 [Mycena capillaripes]|nr:hypothetical protein B0H19DRAFT_960642 [Mycena capillaripes]